jgi:TolB-like protein/DNA-binding SARP family transcriptional activator/Tfp pilus assembly protein PilF
LIPAREWAYYVWAVFPAANHSFRQLLAPGSNVYLRIFGGASIDGPAGPLGGRAAQRHRLGLLTLLALHPRITREKVIAYLWPSASEARGRRLLSDSIYRIHQGLKREAVVATGEDLRLDADCLPCDAVDFRNAMAAGDFQRAVELYAGPLLDGFFIPDADEFERWSSGMRDELAAEHARALEALAQAAEQAGDATTAARWWRRRAAADPLSSRVTLRLMEALARTGDRGEAIRHARAHERLLENELGAAPDPAVVALLERLQQDPDPAPRGLDPRPGALSPAQARNAAAGGPAGEPASSASLGSTGEPEEAPRTPRPDGKRALVAVLAIVGLVVIVATTFFFARGPDARGGPRDIAVLPFTDLGPGGEHAYFADGIAEELIAVLGAVEGLRVVGRTSAFALRDRELSARRIGEELGVGAIVEGSVRVFDDRLRVTARLVDVASGYHLWSETYDRRVEDVLQIQNEIVRSIASRLQGRLLPAAPSGGSVAQIDPDAYNLYLQGRFFWHRRTGPDLRRSVRALEEAVRRAPDYARAHVGLGDAYAVLGFYDFLPPHVAFPRAKSAALRALELDPSLAAAHATLGYVALYYEWEWERAEAEFLRSIELAPSYSTAHQWYANFLTAMGRFPEAEAAMRRAQELDPLSLIANAALGWVHYYAADYDQAMSQCLRTLELDPSFALAQLWLGQALERVGRFDEAAAAIERALGLGDQSAISRAALARVLALDGQPDRARSLLAELEAEDGESYLPPYEIARVYEALGSGEDVMGWLERALSERSHSMVFLRVDPGFETMRGDPAFERLAARVGLAER